MTKQQKIAVAAGIVIVPLVLLFLFNALIVAPQLAETQAEGRGLSVQRFSNPVRLDQTLAVQGAATFADDLTVSGDLTASSIVTSGNATLTSVSTTGNITDAGALRVTGAATLNGGIVLPAGGITINSVVYTATSPITISGVLTNVILLYKQQ
jgi:hypothetical protein